MATEKQIAANRANAQRSTGPKTLAGKLKSSRNAYRHGLSSQLQLDPLTAAKADTIAQALVGAEPNEQTLAAATEFARAQLELLRIRSTLNCWRRLTLSSTTRKNWAGLRRWTAMNVTRTPGDAERQ
jgi:hypothetical protein